ncbi:aminodeoxychorismate lyase [Shewanella gaetbuli]
MALVWVNQQQAGTVNPFDRGLAYGDGMFATMRTCQASINESGIALFDVHLSRLQQGCLRLGIQWQPSKPLKQHLLQLASEYPNHCIKLLLSRGVGGRGYQAPTEATITEVTSVHDIPANYQQWQQQGINLTSSSVKLAKQPLLAGMKHLNRLEQVLIKSAPLPVGADDWLVLDSDNHIVESSMANIFFVKAGEVYTPALSCAGVSGVMRQAVINQMLALGCKINITPMSYDDLATMESALISNSLIGLVNINRIDDKAFVPWELTPQVVEHLNL